MSKELMRLNNAIYQKARLSRDARFDGKFFIAVKTTGIYCRPICPVTPPKEINVRYFSSAIECANAGYRPCLRCRPDSAPNSPAWQGVNATLDRAMRLIDEGCLQTGTLTTLAERLGISDRYLRQLFSKHLGTSPKKYALYQQCLFAKQLLQQTNLPITEIALASGFDSIRRFNDCFKSRIKLTPSAIRKPTIKQKNQLTLSLYYRPPFHWPVMQKTLATRAVDGLEWCTKNGYGRTFVWHQSYGKFTATHHASKNMFAVQITLNNTSQLKAIMSNIRRILDVDVDMEKVDHDLSHAVPQHFPYQSGIRLPGIWQLFEAGIRAILGQQISVVAARNLVTTLVHNLGKKYDDYYLFPTPTAIANSELTFLKIPASRKETLKNLALHYCNHPTPNNTQNWLALKGIGPWTVNYAKMRGNSDPDIFLASDLGIIKAIKKSTNNLNINPTFAGDDSFKAENAAPWRSYLTFQLWNQL